MCDCVTRDVRMYVDMLGGANVIHNNFQVSVLYKQDCGGSVSVIHHSIRKVCCCRYPSVQECNNVKAMLL